MGSQTFIGVEPIIGERRQEDAPREVQDLH